MPSFKFHRGDYVEDLIEGIKGCITARMDSITRCNQYWVQPSVDKGGKRQDGLWIDEGCLILDTSKGRLKLEPLGFNEPPG